MNRRIIRSLALALALTAVAAPSAHAARMETTIEVSKFLVGKDGIRALGHATSQVGENHRTREVTLKVNKGATCSVLDLSIKRLDLTLLGLNLTTSAINLQVKGDPKRTLGRLFCRLSRELAIIRDGSGGGKKKKQKRIVRSLNRQFRDRERMPTIGFSGRLVRQQETSPYAPCEVLNLVIGPIHVDLIGLILDLYGATKNDPVTAIVTADPNRGVLGAKFCELAGGPKV